MESIAQEYVLAWTAYLAAAVLVYAVIWWWTSKLPWLLIKAALRLAILALMIAPMPHLGAEGLWLPAIIIATLGWFLEGESIGLGAWRLLGVASLLAVLLALPMAWLDAAMRKRLAPSQSAQEEPQANGMASPKE